MIRLWLGKEPGAEAKRRAVEEERRWRQTLEPRPTWRPSTRAAAIGSLIGAAVIGSIGVRLVVAPPTPVPPPTLPAPTRTAIFALPAEQERALKPKDTFKECGNCPEMIVVPAGTFTMGSPANEPERFPDEGPQRTVSFHRPFAVGRFALTFDEWDACVADRGCNGYIPDDEGWGRGRRPVINVSWSDAEAYITWLSRKAGKTYRLLSEAEREYVTRAGTTTPFWWGNSISASQANYNGNFTYENGVKGEFRMRTVPVDSFEPNPWGLYQVHGNVYDWTEDCWHDSYQGAPADGSPWTGGNCLCCVARGGSWDVEPGVLRSADRYMPVPDYRVRNVGFRLGRTLLAP